MPKTIKARYQAGKLEPLEPLDLEEGKEVVITVSELATPSGVDAFAATSGAWKDLLDCEQFEKDIYESRRLHTRPEVSW
jgi:predicted DNA-binding antitoxin AbrB/MazE fold protein